MLLSTRRVTVAACSLLACTSPTQIECPTDVSGFCNMGTGGRCLPTGNGQHFCAYANSACPSGLEWGEGSLQKGTCVAPEMELDAPLASFDARPGVGVDAPDAEQPDSAPSAPDAGVRVTLTVGTQGTGTVRSQSGSINCGTSCSDLFPAGTTVTLVAQAGSGWTFTGWGAGATSCGIQTSCDLPIAAATSVTATFVANGTAIWSKQLNALPNPTVNAVYGGVTVDGEGSTLLTTLYTQDLVFDGTTYKHQGTDEDIFVAKLSAVDGHTLWAKPFGGTQSDFPTAIAVDSIGDVLLAGVFTSDSIDFDGPQPMQRLSPADFYDAFLVKLKADGSYFWSQQLSGSHGVAVNAIAIGPSGNVLVAGTSGGNVDLGDGGMTGYYAFIAEYKADTGALVWKLELLHTRPVGMSLVVNGLGSDSQSNVVVAGSFTGSLTVDGKDITSSASDGFVAWIPHQGHITSIKALGGSGQDSVRGLVVDLADNVLVTGRMDFSASTAPTIEGHNVSGSGTSTEAIAAKFSSAATYQWATRIGSNLTSSALAVTNASDQNFLVTGSFSGDLDLQAAGTLTAVGSIDGFVVKLMTSDGSARWGYRFGGVNHAEGESIAQTALGRVVLWGIAGGGGDFFGRNITAPEFALQFVPGLP